MSFNFLINNINTNDRYLAASEIIDCLDHMYYIRPKIRLKFEIIKLISTWVFILITQGWISCSEHNTSMHEKQTFWRFGSYFSPWLFHLLAGKCCCEPSYQETHLELAQSTDTCWLNNSGARQQCYPEANSFIAFRLHLLLQFSTVLDDVFHSRM